MTAQPRLCPGKKFSVGYEHPKENRPDGRFLHSTGTFPVFAQTLGGTKP